MQKKIISQVFITICLLIFSTYAYSEVRYNATNLSDVGFSWVSDMNSSGQVVGTTSQGAAVWDSVNGFQYLGNIAGASSTNASAINDLGQVVGTCRINNTSHIFTWDSTNGMQDFGVQNSVKDINNNGQIIGLDFFWDPVNGYTYFKDYYWARAINNQGQVILAGHTLNMETVNKLSLFHNNTITTLLEGIDTGPASSTWGINDLGRITGEDYVNGSYSALIYDISSDLLQYLNFFQASHGNGINNFGQVVGYSPEGAFLYENSEVFFLDDLVAEDLDLHFSCEPKINDSGQILVFGNDKNQHGYYLLTPVAVPEPSAMALSFLGLVWLIKRKVRR